MGTNRAIIVRVPCAPLCEHIGSAPGVLAHNRAVCFLRSVTLCYQIVQQIFVKYIVGTKDCMTQVFDEAGVCQAATILRVAPAKVTRVKTADTDGYQAVQLATGTKKAQRVKKAQQGQLGEAA